VGRAGQAAADRGATGVLWLGFTGYYLASFLDFVGLQYISASLERLILYLNPTLVLLLGWVLYGQRIGRHRAVAHGGELLRRGAGVRPSAHGTARPWPGVRCWCFGSAISYALYLATAASWCKRLGALRLAGLATTVACVLCIAQFAAAAAAGVGGGGAGGAVAVAAQCHPVHRAPVLMVMMAIERIGPGLTAQTGMIGPMSTIAMGVLLLDEPLQRLGHRRHRAGGGGRVVCPAARPATPRVDDPA
jgi:drug/metabolite transporter (DMT)-like permease